MRSGLAGGGKDEFFLYLSSMRFNLVKWKHVCAEGMLKISCCGVYIKLCIAFPCSAAQKKKNNNNNASSFTQPMIFSLSPRLEPKSGEDDAERER